jgi:hypothetical protein
MTKNRYGICLAGCGMIGHVHAREWGNHKDRADLYVCDLDGRLAAKIATENKAAENLRGQPPTIDKHMNLL